VRPGPLTLQSIRLSPEESAYRDLVVRVLVHSGGWNETSKRRLAAITALHGRPLRHLQATMRLIALTGPSRRHLPIAAQVPIALEARTLPDLTAVPVAAAPRRKAPRRLLLAASLLLTVNSVVLAVLFVSMLLERNASLRAAKQPDTPSATSTSGRGVQASQVAGQLGGAGGPSAPGAPATHRELLNAIQRATVQMGQDPTAAISSFERSIAAVHAGWSGMDRATLQAIVSAVSDFVAAAGRVNLSDALHAVDLVAAPSDPVFRLSATPKPEQLRPAAFSIAMLARLRRDTDLHHTIIDALRARLSPALGMADQAPPPAGRATTFDDGLVLALRALRARLSAGRAPGNGDPHAALWRAWLELTALAGGNAEVLRLDGLEDLLSTPATGRPPGTDQIAGDLAKAIDWTTPTASARLLRWIDENHLSPEDLNGLLRALAAAQPQRFRDGLTLPADAPMAERIAFRDELAVALGAAVRPTSALVEALVARGRALIDLASSRPVADDAEALSRVAALASFNEACARLDIQDRHGAERALERADQQALRSLIAAARQAVDPPDLAALTQPARSPDGEWALRVLQSQNDRETLNGLLNQIVNAPPTLGPADAGVLVETAMASTWAHARDAAQRALQRHAGQAALTEALLQQSALNRRGLDRMLHMVAVSMTRLDLPGWTDARFPAEARKALLLAHMASILAAQQPDVDALATQIETIYRSVAQAVHVDAGAMPSTATPLPPERKRHPPIAASGDPAGAAAELVTALQRVVTRLSSNQASQLLDAAESDRALAAIGRRRHSRLSTAHGVVQRFHAEQMAAVELLALATTLEQPAHSQRVERTLDDLARARHGATRITEQLIAAERAMAQLWLIRLGYHTALTPASPTTAMQTPPGASRSSKTP
jgi:hypothetical protein